MNTGMYENALTQENITCLKEHGVTMMAPATGFLACGTSGAGRLPEPCEIVEFVKAFFARSCGDMKNLRVLVTAAGTREPIDRYGMSATAPAVRWVMLSRRPLLTAVPR